MIRVSREPSVKDMCNSCINRNEPAYRVNIGKRNAATVISLCRNCLEDLYDEIAETLNK